jgi:hypothetical protein
MFMMRNTWVQKTLKAGFTVIEGAIVLAVASVIVGGTVATTRVLQESKDQSVSREITDIERGYKEYRDLYGSMPGDSNNANVLFDCASCNGDGNGQLDLAPVEYLLFWQHLSSAKMIKGSYNAYETQLGKIYPASKVADNAAYTITQRTPDRTLIQLCSFGNPSGVGALTPEQAKQVDARLDDGNPTSGKIVVEPGNGVAASQCVSSGAYNLSVTTPQCNLLYAIQGSKFSNYNVSGSGVASCGTLTAPTTTDYAWRPADWGACPGCAWSLTSDVPSGTCGPITRARTYTCPSACGGAQTRAVPCVNIQTNAVVADANCTGTKPDVNRTCAGVCPQPAPATVVNDTLPACGPAYSWVLDPNCPSAACVGGTCSITNGAWSACSAVTCGTDGTQNRSVTSTVATTGNKTCSYVCQNNSTSAIVADGNCASAGAKPSNQVTSCNPTCTSGTESQACTGPCACTWTCDPWAPNPVDGTWVPDTWGACSSTCGAGGTQTRTVNCNTSPVTQTRNCMMVNDGTCTVSASPSTSQSATPSGCATASPATSQACTSGTALNIVNTTQSVYITWSLGSSYSGCLSPMP